MTTIIYQDGALYADTRAYSGGSKPLGLKTKVHVLSDGSLLGVSSPQPGFGEAMRNWLEGAELKWEQDLCFSALHVRPNGDVFYYDNAMTASGPIRAPYITIGSGESYAVAGLKVGLSPEDAIKLAATLDPWTNEIVESVSLQGSDSYKAA